MAALIFIGHNGNKHCTTLGVDVEKARERFNKICKEEITFMINNHKDANYWMANINELHIKWTDCYEHKEEIIFFDENNNNQYK